MGSMKVMKVFLRNKSRAIKIAVQDVRGEIGYIGLTGVLQGTDPATGELLAIRRDEIVSAREVKVKQEPQPEPRLDGADAATYRILMGNGSAEVHVQGDLVPEALLATVNLIDGSLDYINPAYEGDSHLLVQAITNLAIQEQRHVDALKQDVQPTEPVFDPDAAPEDDIPWPGDEPVGERALDPQD